MKKIIILSISILLLLAGCQSKPLPKPEIEDGIRGELKVDKNINEQTIDDYLNRRDAVYRDMRMLIDDADYEAIGGDSHLTGYIKGFEVVPYPYICNPEGLPAEVGQGYIGKALFTNNNGKYIPNYEESISIVEELFPRDKVIFLMCGGGGYAGMMKELLVDLGYDQDKIYNVGGYWYYEGKNSIEVKKEEDGKIKYDFGSVPYHSIDFDPLTPINDYDPNKETKEKEEEIVLNNVIDIKDVSEFDKLIENKKSFLVLVYLPGCTSCAAFRPIVKDFVDANDVQMYQMNYQILKDRDNIIKQKIDYTPSIFIFVDGELKAYLDPQSEKDEEIYKTTENLSNWINQYIDVNIVKTNNENNNEGCGDSACKL